MKDRLIINDEGPECYRIVWFLAEEGEHGAILGEGDEVGKEPNRDTERDDWESWKADEAAEALKADRDERGYFWPSRRLAKVALAQIESAVRQEVPWPDWAKTASLNGWKAPKGWRP